MRKLLLPLVVLFGLGVSSAEAAPACWGSDHPAASVRLGYAPEICIAGSTGRFAPGATQGVAYLSSGTYVGAFPARRVWMPSGLFRVSVTLATSGAYFACGWLPAQSLVWDFLTDRFGRLVDYGQIRASVFGYAAACASVPTVTQVATYYRRF